jgi:hypothetical protein
VGFDVAEAALRDDIYRGYLEQQGVLLYMRLTEEKMRPTTESGQRQPNEHPGVARGGTVEAHSPKEKADRTHIQYQKDRQQKV